MEFEAFQRAKDYVGFDAETVDALRRFHPLAEPAFESIADDFYVTIDAHPQARAVVTGGESQISRLKTTLKAWLHSALLGPHDLAYLSNRMRIGRVHVQIQLPQELMFTAVSRVRKGLIDRARATLPACEADSTLDAVNRLLDLELAIMLDSYRESWVNRVRTNERLATIGKFAASIGHELRNPLSIVESSIFLITQRLGQLQIDDQVLNKHQRRIADQARNCEQTVSSLLELARESPPRRVLVQLRSYVEEALAQLNLSPGISTAIMIDDKLQVDIDAGQIRQVLSNLAANAEHALEGRGTISVTAEAGDRDVSLVFEDDGPGIADELAERVFDIWFTTKASGTGVGLALSRKIVEAHGGTLALRPSSRGASFRLFLPGVVRG